MEGGSAGLTAPLDIALCLKGCPVGGNSGMQVGRAASLLQDPWRVGGQALALPLLTLNLDK